MMENLMYPQNPNRKIRHKNTQEKWDVSRRKAATPPQVGSHDVPGCVAWGDRWPRTAPEVGPKPPEGWEEKVKKLESDTKCRSRMISDTKWELADLTATGKTM